MTTQTTAAPTCTKSPPAGITLPCPLCGEADASISVNLASLDDPDAAFCCNECQTEFGVDHVRLVIRKWTAVLSWLDSVPQFPDE